MNVEIVEFASSGSLLDILSPLAVKPCVQLRVTILPTFDYLSSQDMTYMFQNEGAIVSNAVPVL